MLKHTNRFNPNHDPMAQGNSIARPVELFLDFDPVCPGWPPAPQDPPPTSSDASGSGGPEAAVISIDDFRRLKAVLRTARAGWHLRGYPNALERKLRRTRIVGPLDVPADVVTMNSMVRVFDAVSGTHTRLSVAYPQRAGYDADSISVLSPLGTAILGHRAGQTAGPRIEQGSRRFSIEKLLYQPEAAGDLHL